jgi:hypothetical protein
MVYFWNFLKQLGCQGRMDSTQLAVMLLLLLLLHRSKASAGKPDGDASGTVDPARIELCRLPLPSTDGHAQRGAGRCREIEDWVPDV